jgi:hypothetical protein
MPRDAAVDALTTLQGQLITVMAARDTGLGARTAGLKMRVADLEERLGRLERAVPGNSGSSSMPPSPDDLPGKKPPQRSRRPPGS